MDWLDHEEAPPSTPLWYITFSDLSVLLTAFFVMLFGFSSLESHKFKILASSIRQAFGNQEGAGDLALPGGSTIDGGGTLTAGTAMAKNAVFQRAGAILKELDTGNAAEVELDEQGVRLRISGAMLFPSGQATLNPGAGPFLDKVAELARASGGTVVVEGHTDSQPIRTLTFPSNWELAGARAGAVARYLAEKGVPSTRMEAQAFAETRPRAPNQTDEGRQKNRRVEILIRTER